MMIIIKNSMILSINVKKTLILNLLANIDKRHLKNVLNEHQIMIHPASLETGIPTCTVLEAMA